MPPALPLYQQALNLNRRKKFIEALEVLEEAQALFEEHGLPSMWQATLR
jgi:hypothetical protein